MKSLRTLLVFTGLLALSGSTLSAQGGTVVCKDGAKSAAGRGACSGHGGIMTAEMKGKMKAEAKTARAEKKAEKKAAEEKKDDVKAEKTKEMKADMSAKRGERRNESARGEDHEAKGATAECKDHTYSHAATHRGACSRHGGVEKFLDGK